jgi:hypothetical protein
MIKFTFSQRTPNTFLSPSDVRNIMDSLHIVLGKKGFLKGYIRLRYSIFFDTEYKFSIQFDGTSVESKENQIFVINQLAFYLKKVTDLFYISGTSFQTEPDFICDEVIKVTKTKNSQLIKNIVKETDIPQKYTCLLTCQLMDSPVYLKGTPEAVYEEVALKYWLYQQDSPKNPTTNLPVLIHEDIVKMSELKNEINAWVKEHLQTGLTARNQLFFSTLNRYKIGDYGPQGAEKALRKAAYSNNLEDFNFLTRYIVNINQQDESPANMKTAFHWAVTKHSIDIIKRLIELKADPFIKDAANKTCLDYAFESKNEAVKTLIVDYVKALSTGIKPNNF